MVTTFWGIEVGSRALRTQQKALDTTGHNIANANTRGYTRQQAIMSPTSPYTMPGFFSPASAGQMGTGVYVQEIRRIRDQFIDLQIRNELESLGYWEQKSTYLEKIGVIFNEPSDSGLRSVFTKFFNALHNLASNADDPTTRTLVIEQGRAVAETFNHMTRQFRDTVMAVDSTLKAKINEINSYARQIRDLNEQIIRIENAGDRANDLRDKRDVLLDDLAKLISIDYMEMEDGSVLVSTGGRSLVQGVYYKELELKIYDSGDLKGQPRIVWKDSGEDYRFVNVKSSSKSGYAQGSALSGTITVDDTNNVFSLIVDGVTRSITIPNGDYDSDDETAMNNLADLLTDEINNTYAGTGVSVEVTWDNVNKNFIFTSNSTGEYSGVWGFEGPGAELLGLDNATITPGQKEEIVITGGGEIAGLWEVRAVIIPGYVEKLNNLMVRFADTFNNQHNQGYDLNGNLGKNFFALTPEVENDVIAARYLSVEISDPNEIAAASSLDGLPGDGDNAWKLVALRDKEVMNQGKGTFDEYVQSMVGGLGIESQAAIRMVDNQNLLVAQIENQRQSLSGVSLDEEMTNLIKFQHAYGAAARLITVVDEMLEVIISRLGVVGR